MNAERLRTQLLALPHVVETMQWGESLVFWVGDKAIGGKMFALLALDAAPGQRSPLGHQLLSFATEGPEAYAGLLEREGLVPAPYLARIHWVSVTQWDALTSAEWTDLLAAAHARVLTRLSRTVRSNLALPAREQQRLILARRKELADKAAAKPPRRASRTKRPD